MEIDVPGQTADDVEGRSASQLAELRNVQSWYELDSGLHARCRRIALELVSESPSSQAKVCEYLVAALADGQRRPMPSGNGGNKGKWERDPAGELITVGGATFESRAALKARCLEILREHTAGEEERELGEAEFALMKAVLAHHPRGSQKLRDCCAMVVAMHPLHKTRCFFVVRPDGREDFSFFRCVANAPTEEFRAQEKICDVVSLILKLHPAACEAVAEKIERSFPSYRGKEGPIVEKHRNWTKCILKLCGQTPVMAEFLLRVLVRRMVEIDTAVHRLEEHVPLDEERAAEVVEEGDEPSARLNSMADILDGMMILLFEFVQRNLSGDHVGPFEHQLAAALFGIFENNLLLTPQARCVQFLWFYLVSLRPSWTEAFLSLLLRTAFDSTAAIPKRLVSLAYLASFIARASFLTRNFVVRTVQFVATLARENLVVAEGHLAQHDATHPQVMLFLYAVQATCYMLCFHMDDFAFQDPATGKTALDVLFFEGTPERGSDGEVLVQAFAPVFDSPANPIARINQQVVEQFSSCLERVRPSLAGSLYQKLDDFEARGNFCVGDNSGLDVFFPFDPYRLRHSSMFVSGIYRFWREADPKDSEHADNHAEGFAAKAGGPQMTRVLSGTSDCSGSSDVDFTDAKDATERGFIPSVGPSPAFCPRGTTDLAEIMSPLGLAMEDAMPDDETFALPSATVPLDGASSMLSSFLQTASFREGGPSSAVGGPGPVR